MNKHKQRDLVEIKPKTDLVGIKETNKVVVSLMGLTASLVLSLLGNLFLLGNNHELATKEKIFVEQRDGATSVAIEKNRNFRSEEVILKTVSNWLYLTWEWDSRISGSDLKDKGVVIRDDRTDYIVPSKVYTASYLIEEGFRREFLKQMAQLIPEEVYSGGLTSQFFIYHLGVPIRKGDRYEVSVIATRVDLSSSGEKLQAKFNKKIVLKPVEPYRNILGNKEPSAFRKHLAQLMSGGLIIESIQNYE